jgi:hypothetical protein
MGIAWPVVAQEFSVTYDGPAVDDARHSIDASVLGNSLLALTELLGDAQEVLHPDGPDYRVRVRATGEGSFAVFLEVKEVWDQIARLLTDRDAQAIETLLTVFVSFVHVMRQLRGRTPDRVEHGDDSSVFQVDDKEIVVERRVGDLYSSRKVRRSFRRFVEPVTRDVVEEMKVRIPEIEPTTFTPDDRTSFDAPFEDETVLDEVVEMRLKIETIRWRTYRWEFSTPATGIFWATIEDQGFRARIDQRHESFDKGDFLDGRVHVHQWDEGDGTYRIERTVLTVLGHLPGDAGQQEPLDRLEEE